jgi:hypothetical protein
MSDTPDKKVQKLKDVSAHVKVCSDFFNGAVAVMNSSYLPKLTGEGSAGYKVRVASTTFPNMYSPVVSTITGLVTKKEPSPNGLEKFDLEDVDLNGSGITAFIKRVCERSIVGGIEFVAVQTFKQNENDAGRSYFKRYKYENLMSYVVESDVVTQLVFEDKVEVQDGRFGIKKQTRYIVFKENGGEVWYDDGGGLKMHDEDSWVNTLGLLPVVAFTTGKVISAFEVVPRLYDIARMNWVMLNVESQLANVLSVVGNPVPCFYGSTGEMSEEEEDVDGNQRTIQIGVHDALIFANRQEEGFEWAEIEGEGVSKLQEQSKAIASGIDKLSFSMLLKEGSNTVIDAQESSSKSSSFLTDIAVELESGFNKLYEISALMQGDTLADDAGIEFKKDFDDVLFSDDQLKLMMDLVLADQLSRETLWNKLKVAGILPKDFDEKIEAELIDAGNLSLKK